MTKKNLLIVLDPVSHGVSAQLEILKPIVKYLAQRFNLTIYSSIISDSVKEDLKRLGAHVATPTRKFSISGKVLNILRSHNESMLWLSAWVAQSLFLRNSHFLSRTVRLDDYDVKINMTNPTFMPCDIWWNQGYPLYHTLDLSIRNYRFPLRLAFFFLRPFMEMLDWKMLNRQRDNSKSVAFNSKSLADYYSEFGFPPGDVIYPAKDLNNFVPSKTPPTRDYVLTYLGKETELSALKKITQRGIPMISFGGKLPKGMKMASSLPGVVNLGYVSDEKLVQLFQNALFTAFPFTNEQFGLIPLESMACGTPVLTYNRGGPGETVLDNETGWLVSDENEFVKKASELWVSKSVLHIDIEKCRLRALQYDQNMVGKKLLNLIERALPEKTPRSEVVNPPAPAVAVVPSSE
ncbi:MAG: glycosyltransferase [Thermoplasmataceae archaeon]